MTAHKHGGWHQEKTMIATPQPDPSTINTSVKKPPSDSWWTKAQSREEFDRLALERSREAGWVGKPRESK